MSAGDSALCQPCGACCAALRVGFPAHEAVTYGLPSSATEPWFADHLRLRGTAAAPRRCSLLSGQVGVGTACSAYEHRPSPCRSLLPTRPDRPSPYCDAARALHGLPPLPGAAAVQVDLG